MLILKGLFTTITNVNFNNVTIKQLTEEIHIERNRINSQKFDDYDMKKLWNDHEDIRSLKSLILFGIKVWRRMLITHRHLAKLTAR